MKWLYINITCAVLVIIILVTHESTINKNERSARHVLATIAPQQARWRVQDVDANGIKDKWTYDLSCLHRTYRKNSQLKVNFIPGYIAWADTTFSPTFTASNIFDGISLEDWSSLSPKPFGGYWFKAMKYDGNGIPYNQNPAGKNKILATNPEKFAFVAYPEKYGISGVLTFSVNEWNWIYGKDLGPNPNINELERWPADNPSTKGWISYCSG